MTRRREAQAANLREKDAHSMLLTLVEGLRKREHVLRKHSIGRPQPIDRLIELLRPVKHSIEPLAP
jgi:hypothetical protein